MNRDKNKPFWVVAKNGDSYFLNDVNGVQADMTFEPEDNDAKWAQDVCDFTNHGNGQV